jgi:hypothetical protein
MRKGGNLPRRPVGVGPRGRTRRRKRSDRPGEDPRRGRERNRSRRNLPWTFPIHTTTDRSRNKRPGKSPLIQQAPRWARSGQASFIPLDSFGLCSPGRDRRRPRTAAATVGKSCSPLLIARLGHPGSSRLILPPIGSRSDGSYGLF